MILHCSITPASSSNLLLTPSNKSESFEQICICRFLIHFIYSLTQVLILVKYLGSILIEEYKMLIIKLIYDASYLKNGSR